MAAPASEKPPAVKSPKPPSEPAAAKGVQQPKAKAVVQNQAAGPVSPAAKGVQQPVSRVERVSPFEPRLAQPFNPPQSQFLGGINPNEIEMTEWPSNQLFIVATSTLTKAVVSTCDATAVGAFVAQHGCSSSWAAVSFYLFAF